MTSQEHMWPRKCFVATFGTTIAMLAIPGCGGSTSTPPPEAFAIDGAWSYLGPSDVPHDLTISNGPSRQELDASSRSP